MGRLFFFIVILPADVVLHLVLLLGGTVANGNVPCSPLHLAVLEYLLTAHMLSLESPQSRSFLFVLFLHLVFSYLLVTLVKNCASLFLIQAFEVVWFNTVGC